MNSTQKETSVDIITEMRELSKSAKRCECEHLTTVYGLDLYLAELADRFEAALKREKAAIEAEALAAGGIVETERHKPGNAAAMRKALEKCLHYLTGETELVEDEIIALCDVMNAALAAPPRNCDVGTPEEQEDRFFAFCRVHECTMNCPIKKKWSFKCEHNPSCGVLFGQQPYEEGGAK